MNVHEELGYARQTIVKLHELVAHQAREIDRWEAENDRLRRRLLETELVATATYANCSIPNRKESAMTDIQLLYLKTRTEQKCGHRAALRSMAKVTGIDPDSIDRALQRARRTDAIESKRARKASKEAT